MGTPTAVLLFRVREKMAPEKFTPRPLPLESASETCTDAWALAKFLRFSEF